MSRAGPTGRFELGEANRRCGGSCTSRLATSFCECSALKGMAERAATGTARQPCMSALHDCMTSAFSVKAIGRGKSDIRMAGVGGGHQLLEVPVMPYTACMLASKHRGDACLCLESSFCTGLRLPVDVYHALFLLLTCCSFAGHYTGH